MNKTFSKGEAIRFGWEQVKKDPVLWLGVVWAAMGIPLLVSLASTILEGEEQNPFFAFVLFLVVLVLSLGLQLGVNRAILNGIDGEKVSFGQLWGQFGKVLSFLVTQIFVVFIVILGLLLFIIPGIIWGIKYSFVPYIMADKKVGPMEALKQSGAITQGVKWKLLVFNIVMGLVMVAGVLALGVGVLVALPVITIAQGYVYRKLEQQTAAEQIPQAQPVS